MRAILESLEPKNTDKINKYFGDVNFMKKVFLFRYGCYSENEWENFCKDCSVDKFQFQVIENKINIDLEIKNEESVVKKIIQFIEEYIDENMSPEDSFFGYKVFKLYYENKEFII